MSDYGYREPIKPDEELLEVDRKIADAAVSLAGSFATVAGLAKDFVIAINVTARQVGFLGEALEANTEELARTREANARLAAAMERLHNAE